MRKKKRKQTKIWKIIFIIFSTLFLTGSGILFFIAQSLPSIDEIKKTGRRPSIIFQNDQGETISSYGDMYGELLSPKDLPPHVVGAILAIEDRRFYSHFGVDIFGIIRALYSNIIEKNSLQGASTLTQQLAKNFLISTERFNHSNRSMKRKIQELLLSLWLERNFSKDEILMMYLNRSYFGSGTLGIDAAAQKYFGKSAKTLNIMEGAVLAGLLKAPSKYSPHHNPELAIKRARTVISAMVEGGFIDAQKKIQNDPDFPTLEHSGSSVRYFFDWVLDTVPDLVGIINDDIIVSTTLDVRIQKQADTALKAYLKNNTGKASQGAVLVMDKYGAVKAMIGGASYRKSSFNRVTQAQRQSGSAFKLFVYLAALENGFEPSSLVEDKRRTYSKKWSPRNYGNQYLGTVSLSTAFAKSLNTVSVYLCNEIGPQTVIKMARRLGITSEIPVNLSIALGSCDNSLLEITSAYGTVSNMGQEMKPFGIISIKNRENQELYENKIETPSQILTTQIAGQMHELLTEVVQSGTGRKAGIPGINIAGKTGTTQNHKDAWFIGYTNDYVIGVWLGNDNGAPMKEVTGGKGPAIIFKEIIQYLNFEEPKGSIESILKEFED